jgi:heme exporter protein D
MSLGVSCECGRTLPVTADDAGSRLSCPCGRKVVVPLKEEFAKADVLPSAPTPELRLRRLLREGALPRLDACALCRKGRPRRVDFYLDCERSRVRTSGGFRFLIIPFLWHIVYWTEEVRVERIGRDTCLPAPLALCPACLEQVRRFPVEGSLLLFGVLTAVSAALFFLDVWLGIGMTVLTLLGVFVKVAWDRRSRQRGLRELLRKEPVYRQVLDRYPNATVLVPEEPRPTAPGEPTAGFRMTPPE